MFDQYNTRISTNTYNTVKVNAVSGSIIKTYRESWFETFPLKSYRGRQLLDEGKTDVVLQMVLCGDMEVMVELIKIEDLDKYLLIPEQKKENQ